MTARGAVFRVLQFAMSVWFACIWGKGGWVTGLWHSGGLPEKFFVCVGLIDDVHAFSALCCVGMG